MDFSQNPSPDLGGSGKAKNNPIISIKLSYVWIIDSSEYLGGVGRALMNQSKGKVGGFLSRLLSFAVLIGNIKSRQPLAHKWTLTLASSSKRSQVLRLFINVSWELKTSCCFEIIISQPQQIQIKKVKAFPRPWRQRLHRLAALCESWRFCFTVCFETG